MANNKRPIEIFMPPNVLKAKMGSGKLDLSAVKRAEQAIDSLKSEFTGWVIHDVSRLVEAGQAYAKDRNEEALADLYRTAHDLKGQAATFDFPLISRVAASLCMLTDDTVYGLPLPLKLIEAHIDAIRVIVRDNLKDPSDQTAAELATELETQVAGFLEKHAAA
jgi:HPt (histidine-containing phosphotransfer) domain-containing protein